MILFKKIRKTYYPQVFLEECIYIVKKKISKYISDDLETSSSDSDEGISKKE